MSRLSFILFLSIFLVSTSCNTKSGKRNNESNYYRVTKIIDGDTFWIDDGSEKGVKVRLIGVDAPETRNTRNKEKSEYGIKAKEYITNLINDNSIRIEFDVDKYDRYGRILAYVYLKDGTFINATLIEHGYAMVMTVPPNVKYEQEFVELQKLAREENRGLWSSD